jgi:F-type H+-transporting ATPase subunit b
MRIIGLAALVLLAAATVALGAEQGGGEDHGLPWMNFIFRLVNFIIFIGLIWWLAGSKIKDFFVGRKDDIKNKIEDLEGRRAKAEERLREVESRIAGIEAEREEILKKFREQGEKAKEAIIEEAEKKAALTVEQAEQAAGQEYNQVMAGLRSEVADMIVDAAERILSEKLSAEDHQKLVDEYIKKVELQ